MAATQQQPQGFSFQMPIPQGAQYPQQQTRRVFDLIPVPYGDLLPYLVHSKMVTPRTLKPMTTPFPSWYKQGATCEFHSGAEGHTIENCKAFKYKVQELIDQKLLTFKEVGPNVKGNPLPSHSGANVNNISSTEELIRDVSAIKTPSVRETLINYDQFLNMDAKCEICEENPSYCTKMKECLQKLMDQGLVQIGYSKNEPTMAMVDQHEHEKGLKPIEIIYRKAKTKYLVEQWNHWSYKRLRRSLSKALEQSHGIMTPQHLCK
jgi:hypothetical protein